ncbi:putative late blight resistance protein-like protein R1A-10 [Forsythia ovata]|uniref:Late blight resistance protein-like protein R1A-10 n=1 Tax=Forsythia ovata TaxID=205694 RepID=A0ABD1WU13_9LAMI
MSTFGSLPNLEVLKLKDFDFEDSVWKTNEGEFRKLKFLHIRSNNLEFWEVEGTHLPSLQCLSLGYCPRLKCIPSEIGEIPTLQVIALFQCGLSVVTSANSIQEEQQDLGNDGLQLVPQIALPTAETTTHIIGQPRCVTNNCMLSELEIRFNDHVSSCKFIIFDDQVKAGGRSLASFFNSKFSSKRKVLATSVEDYDPIDDVEQYEDFIDEYQNDEPNLDNDDSEDGANEDHSDDYDVLENDAD